jgi:hypothetical protein
MFAPWIIYKEDFNSIGGHDSIFAPFPYEDSDLFQRWLLNGYELVQSRDAFVYHLTCRGHRWTDEIRKDSDDFKLFEKRARKNYLRKWGSWVKNDVYQHPIISPVYHKTLVIRGLTTLNFIEFLEPLFNKILMHNGCKTIVNKFLDLENELNSIEPPIKCELDSKFVYYDEELFSVDDTNVAVFIDAGTIKNEDIDLKHIYNMSLCPNIYVNRRRLLYKDCFPIFDSNKTIYDGINIFCPYKTAPPPPPPILPG